jgi:hypothetical protein
MLVVQPLRSATSESAALGRKLLVARAAESASSSSSSSSSSCSSSSSPRRAPRAGRVAASIPTASLRVVNRSAAPVYFKIQSKAGAADFCVQPESGTLRAQSAVIVAVVCVSERDPAGAIFRCKWGGSPASTQSSSKFQLEFHPTLLSSGSGGSDHDGSSHNNTKSSSGGGASPTKPSQAGWPPWERSDYSGDDPSAEDVDAERSAAYEFIAKNGTTNANAGHSSPPKNSQDETSFCCSFKSLLLQGTLIFAALWAFAFSFPEKTGGLGGIFTRESVVLPSFVTGMLAQWLRARFFGAQTAGAGKSKHD